MIDVLQLGLFYENIMRIVHRKGLRYPRDDHDHFNHEDTLVDNAPADPAGPAIGRIRSATDRRFMYRGSFAGGRSWLTLSRPLELLSQPRW